MNLPVVNKKPVLHQSQIVTFTNCGMQYYYSNVEGIRRAPGIALITGTAVHSSVEENIKNKIDTGLLLPEEQVLAVAADSVRDAWEKDDVALTTEEREEGEGSIKGSTIDLAVTLARLHHQQLAPKIEAISVERQFKLELPNFPVDLAGTMDIEEANGLRDTKTYAKVPGQDSVDRSVQLSLYALAKRSLDKKEPGILSLDILVKSKKNPRVVVMETTRSPEDYRTLLRRIEIISRAIESGIFIPTVADDWRCSEKWCGFFEICPYGSRNRTKKAS